MGIQTSIVNTAYTRFQQWAVLCKIAWVKRITQADFDRLYTIWQAEKQDRLTSEYPRAGYERMKPGVHGVTRVRNECIQEIRIRDQDPPKRREVTVVHEALHAWAHPIQPDHGQLHFVAVTLVQRFFKEEDKMGYNDLFSRDYVVLTDEENGNDDADVSPAIRDVLNGNEYDLYRRGFWRKKKKSSSQIVIPPQQFGVSANQVLLPGGGMTQLVRNPGEIAMEAVGQYRGWMMPALPRLFSAQAYTWPLRGVVRTATKNPFSGYRATDFGAFFGQLINSINSKDVKSTKAEADAIAVAALATVATLPTGVFSIGVIVTITPPADSRDVAPVPINHFTQVGGQVSSYTVHRELANQFSPITQYILLNIRTDRGAGIVTAETGMAVTIPADKIAVGSRLYIETINMLELEPA